MTKVTRPPKRAFPRAARLAILALVTGCLVGGLPWAAADTRPAPLVLDEPPAPHRPSRPRTPEQQDRLDAIALFATARSAQQDQRYAKALALYQHAARLDPESAEIVQAIVPLAFRLGQPAVAVRYALKTVELQQHPDPLLLRRLAAYLSEQGDWTQALKLYEQAAAAGGATSRTASDILLRLEMGRLYHLTDQFDRAADCFATVVEALDQPRRFALDEQAARLILGQAEETYALFGEVFLAADRLEQARDAFERAHRATPDQARLDVQLARIHLRRDESEKAIALLEDALKDEPENMGTVPYRVLAEALEQLGRRDELLGQLENLHARHPRRAPLRYYLAEQYLAADRLDRAGAIYEGLIEQAPLLSGYRQLVDIYRRTDQAAKLLDVLGTFAGRTGELDSLLIEVQRLVDDHEMVDRLVTEARRRSDAAEKSLDFGTAMAMALVLLEADRYDDAREFFEAAIAADGSRAAEVLLSWGVGLLLDDRPARSAELFQRALDEGVQPSSDALFHFYLAGALELSGKTDAALAAARQAAEARPDTPQFQLRPAWVLYHAERYDDAAAEYRRVIDRLEKQERIPELREVLRESRLVLSAIEVEQGQLAQAEGLLLRVLDEFPNHIGAMNDLGYLWADQNKHLHRAVRMIHRAVEAEPNNAAYRDSLGWVNYRLENYPEAVAELEKAAKKQSDAIIFDHLGDAYDKLGKRKKAREAWRRAMKEFRKADKADEAKAVEKKIKKKKK